MMNLLKNYHRILCLLIFYIFNYIACISENCQDSCVSCQNTLYYLKFRGDADCKFNRCQGLVIFIH